MRKCALTSRFRQVLNCHLKQCWKNKMTIKRTLTLTELSVYIGIPKRTLFDMIRDKRFPVDPIVKTTPRMWSTEQVDGWLRGQTK